MTTTRILIEPDRSFAGGIGAGVATLGLVGVTVAFAIDPGISLLGRAVTGSLGALLSATVAFSAWRLLSARGGLFVDDAARRLGIGVTSADDVWWVPFERILGIRVHRIAPAGDVVAFRWCARLELTGGVGVAIAESTSRELVETVAERLCNETGFRAFGDDDEDAPRAPAPVSAEVDLRVRHRVAMHGMLSLLGASSTAVGAVLYSQVATAPVFGFLFAPVLMALGMALLASVLVKRMCREEIVHQRGLWTHRFAFGERWRWSEREITAPQPAWTLRVLALRGARLELEGSGGDLIIMGNGATTHSNADIEALASLPAQFAPKP